MTLLGRVNLLLFVLMHLNLGEQIKGGVYFYLEGKIFPLTCSRCLIYAHTECLMIKINLRKTKWLLIYSYNPLKSTLVCLLNTSKNTRSQFCRIWETLYLIRDFNSETTKKQMWCFARFGTICTILKTWETVRHWCFSRFLKLYKCY